MKKKTRLFGIDPIGWSLQDPFPETVTVGTDYEEVYQLVSNLPAPMPAPLTVTYTGGSDFTVEDQCSGLFLAPGQTCNVTVRFTPSSAGVQQFQLTLHYFNDVVPLPVQTLTAAGSTILIEGSVTQALPATTVVESIYPVIFTFQNVGATDATNLMLDRNYPADFTEESDTCSTTLAVGASCTVQGSLVPSNPGSYTVAAALFYAESETPASVSTSTEAITITVTGTVTTPLPDPTVVGESFPVVFTYTNNSPLAATGVAITTDYPTGFTQQSDTCTNTLAANTSCTIQGTFTPATAGDFTVAVSLAYAESSNPVPLETSTTADVGALGIVGDVTTPLPATTSIDVSYPVVFTYTNEGSVPATGLNITPTYPPEFTQQSNTCSGSLAVGATCTVEGTLLPTSASNYTVGVSLAYAQSVNPVPLSTNTTTIVLDITGDVSTPLPATTALNTSYPVVFSYTNHSAIVATDLVLTPNYPTGFTEEENTCASGTLAAGQTCSIEGSFIPASSGNHTVATSLTYAGAPAPIPLSTNTSTISIDITGDVSTPLPSLTVVGENFPVVFTYTNNSALPATGIDITKDYPTGFTESSVSCTDTLAAGASCTIQGNLTPATAGDFTVAVSLAYDESSNPVPLSTSTEAITITITGAVTTPLPDPTVVGESFPVEFTYTNDSALAATGVAITTDYPTGFIPQSDTCTNTLAANTSCTIQGTFTPATAGDFTVAVSLAYAESSNPVPLETSTTADVGALGIVGNVTTPLPATTSIDVSYPVVFTYTNEGSVPATGLNITPTYPPEFTQQSNTCSGSLAVGATCTVEGTLLPTSAGSYTVGVSLAYAQSINPVPLSTNTTTIVLDITGDVSTPLPATTALNTSYPVVFSYTNHSAIVATDLVLTPNYPTGFTEEENTCASGTLAAGQTCSIEGSFIPASSGNHTVATSLTYAGAPAPIPLSTSTSTLEFVLTGEVSTPLPGTLELGNEYPVVFTYTNDSPLPATNLVFTDNYPADFMQTATTCTTTLASNASCTVSGSLMPSNTTPPGQVTVEITLTYSEGSPIELTTSSDLESQVVITGTVVEALPPTETTSATPLPVTFEFTNTGNAPATGLALTTHYPPEFTQNSDDCTGTLAVNASCQITGSLDINATGNYSVGVTLNTTELAPVTLTTQTSIITAEVVGSVEQALPSSSIIGTGYPVTFLFTNEGGIDATAVNIVTNYPSDFEQTSTTCGTTLAAGASCSVMGTLTPTSEGSQAVAITFQYAEGGFINLLTSTTVGTLVLQGIVQQGFPDVATVNTPYPLIFKYTNPNATEATGLNISTVPSDLDITSNTCTGTLAANASCTVEANFTPTQVGSYTAGVTLSYDQGAPIPLNTYTVIGNSLLIAVGDTGFFRTSPDWGTWTNRDIGSNVTLQSGTFSPELQLFSIVGSIIVSGTTYGFIRATKNGVTYTDFRWEGFFPQYVTWSSDLSQFLTVGLNGGIATSMNAINWKIQTSNVSVTLRGAIWNSQLRQYVVVGSGGTILTSPNGIDWQQQTSETTDALYAVTWSPELGLYVVVTGNANSVILNSVDGMTWTNPGATNLLNPGKSVTWSPQVGRFLYVGVNNFTATSDNGTTWQNQQVGSYSINDVIWFDRQSNYYAVGAGSYVYKSTTGLGDMRSKYLVTFSSPTIFAIAAGAVVP